MKIPQQVVSDSLKILLRGTVWVSDAPQGQGIKKQNKTVALILWQILTMEEEEDN